MVSSFSSCQKIHFSDMHILKHAAHTNLLSQHDAVCSYFSFSIAHTIFGHKLGSNQFVFFHFECCLTLNENEDGVVVVEDGVVDVDVDEDVDGVLTGVVDMDAVSAVSTINSVDADVHVNVDAACTAL
jgi:hypothetical protein